MQTSMQFLFQTVFDLFTTSDTVQMFMEINLFSTLQYTHLNCGIKNIVAPQRSIVVFLNI